MIKVGPIIQPLLRMAGYELRPVSRPPSQRALRALKQEYGDVTEREWEIYFKIAGFTLVSIERVVANIRAIDYVVSNNIPGDIVECGVWRGGSSMSLALALGDQRRTLWMYDTYSGMTDPTDFDAKLSGESASKLINKANSRERDQRGSILCFASLEDVQANMQSTGYPLDRIRFIKGPVEQTIPESMPESIALLRLDTDWYESTRHELEHLYPRLSPGGVLIIDDYGEWQGARKAVDEYLGGKLFLNRIDLGGRLGIKPKG